MQSPPSKRAKTRVNPPRAHRLSRRPVQLRPNPVRRSLRPIAPPRSLYIYLDLGRSLSLFLSLSLYISIYI